ncbi:MAG: hypothetical protein ACTSWN_16580 [Promethearchaeota archaeon]
MPASCPEENNKKKEIGHAEKSRFKIRDSAASISLRVQTTKDF